jgi:hypothetical protein
MKGWCGTLAGALLLAQVGAPGGSSSTGAVTRGMDAASMRPLAAPPVPAPPPPAPIWVPGRHVPVPGEPGGVFVPGYWAHRLPDGTYLVPPHVIVVPGGIHRTLPGGSRPAPDTVSAP